MRWLIEDTTLELTVEGSYERHFLPRRTDSERWSIAGKSLCFRQRMELNGALSNPRVVLELLALFELKLKVLSRKRAPKKFSPRVLPRTRVPLLATITQVLELANTQPMRVKEIHVASQRLLGKPISYRSLKASLSGGSRGKNATFDRRGYGSYTLWPRD